MDSRNSHEIETAAWALFKKSRKEHLKIDFPNLRDQDIERRLMGEWENMSEFEKFPYIKQVEDHPMMEFK